MLYKQLIKIDEEGFEIEPVLVPVDKEGNLIEELPENLVPTYEGYEGFYKKKWDFEQKKWVEGATKEEIEEIERNSVVEPSYTDRITALEDAILSMLMKS